MIKLENVGKIYGEGESAVTALDNINLEIPKGRFVSIVGKSGSGKSTLLNLIGGLDKPTNGRIIVDGKDLGTFNSDGLSEYRNKSIGFVFQSFFLEPNFTVLENVEMPLVIAGFDKNVRKERALKFIEKLGLSDKTDKKAKTLSGGQKQRVSIARALINEAELILADEPTGNLDSKNGKDVIDLLEKINKDGKTVILVTHNMADALRADTLIEVADGHISAVTNS